MEKIIFDFDYTLFNSKKYRLALQEIFFKIGVSKNDYEKTSEIAREKGLFFSLSKQIALLQDRYPKLPKAKFIAVWKKIDKEMKDFLYKDSLVFLKKIKKRHKIFIVSCGDEKTQKHKIRYSGAEKYFKNIFIERSENKNVAIKNISKKGEETLFVDDNPFILLAAKKDFPSLTIVRINRGQGRYAKDKKKYPIDFTVRNFKELEIILKNENFEVKRGKRK